MKIDFCPNKRRLILLSCPLQLISIDSRSPSGLHSLPNFKMVIKMCFNSRSPSELRPNGSLPIETTEGFNSRSPSRLRLSISAVYIVLLPVSIHAAQASCDGAAASVASSLIGFQFTQPKRAATWACRLHNIFRGFNSRSPSGLRQYFAAYCATHTVSIHAAQAGCDKKLACPLYLNTFQFTQPKRAATWFYRAFLGFGGVSIHAAQAGCDFVLRCPAIVCYMFQFTQPKRAATSGMSERVK